MKYYRVFQAWQNQKQECTTFINTVLKKISKELIEESIKIDIIRFPAQEESGSPDIVGKVWEQIEKCDVFVGDLSKIAEVKEQHISNSNVMYELGIADAILGAERVILLCSNDTDPNKLAFDVNHKRVSKFDINQGKLFKDNLKDWLRLALKEADRQNHQRDHIFYELYSKFRTLYNNFMRMVYSNDIKYSKGVLPPRYEEAVELVKDSEWNELMIRADYSPLLDLIQESIIKMYLKADKAVMSLLIEIHRSLSEYVKINSLAQHSMFEPVKNRVQYLLYHNKMIYLKEIGGYEQIKDSPLNDKNSFFLCASSGHENVFLYDTILKDTYEKCHYQSADTEEGKVSTMNMSCYKLKDDAKETYIKIVINVIKNIFDFMDYMNYVPANEILGSDMRSIISWKKK